MALLLSSSSTLSPVPPQSVITTVILASPMAFTRCLPVLLLVAMTATTDASEDRANFDVTKCYPSPMSTAYGGSAFRGNLLRLLKVLPSAAAPTGFASLQTADRAASDRDRAFVRGLCFGQSAPEQCRRCLSDAGKKITAQCGDANRRAGFWNERCFLDYADGANSSSPGAVFFSGDAVPSPDVVSVQRLVALAQLLAQRAAIYGWVATADATTPASKSDPTDGNRTVRVLTQCARDRGAADCVGCLREASLAMAKSWEAGGGAQGRVAAVLGSNCYLRFEIWTPPLPLGEKIKTVGLLIGLAIFTMIDVHHRIRMKARNNSEDEDAAAAEMIKDVCIAAVQGLLMGMVLNRMRSTAVVLGLLTGMVFEISTPPTLGETTKVVCATVLISGLMAMVLRALMGMVYDRMRNNRYAAAAPASDYKSSAARLLEMESGQ